MSDTTESAVVEEEAVEIGENVAETAPVKKETGPTLQMKSLGGAFETVDRTKSAFVCVKQTGSATMVEREVPVKVRTTEPVMGEDGKPVLDEDGKPKEKVKLVDSVEKKIVPDYTYADNKEQYGDPLPSMTAALRHQATVAKALRNEGYTVKEDLKKEYGVWYAEDPTGAKPGFRFSIDIVERPASMVKQPKAPKEPKERKPREAKEKKPKAETKTTKEKAPKKEETTVHKSDDVDVEISEE